MVRERCVVRDSVIADVYALAKSLRAGDAAEVAALGIDPRDALRRSFRDAILRRTYLVDGEIAAMSGLCGSLLGDIGEPYLMTSDAAERVPVTFVRQARAACGEMLRHRLRLEGHVAAAYLRACRLLGALGFTLAPPEPVGPTVRCFIATGW